MAPRNKPTLSKAHKEGIRKAALARHAARKAAGLLSPSGQSYITPPAPPAPEPVVTPKPAEVPVAAPAAAVAEKLAADVAAPVAAPRDAFKVWLRGREGRDAIDPRMSTDAARMGAELEDRVWAGWQAGYAAGRAEA